MSKYTVFFEQTPLGYSAHVPDLPGWVAAASTLEETRELMREAIEFHVEGMRMHGELVPAPTPHIEAIDPAAPQTQKGRPSLVGLSRNHTLAF